MIIFIPKWMNVLEGYNSNMNSNEISIKNNITYSQVHKISLELEKIGWIKRTLVGRSYKTELTKEGNKVAERSNKLIKQLGG